MSTVTFESIKKTEEGYKIYFTSYLRRDFVEKSAVITTKNDYKVVSIYISSYDFGSLEWINGIGVSECRKWETVEQAESRGYLTRRYTARISDGYAPEGHAEKLLIPDVLESIDNKKIAGILKSIIRTRRSVRKIDPAKFGLE